MAHRQEVRQAYEEYQVLQESLRDYRELMARPENLRLLEKALRLGEISAAEYFMELSFYYGAYDRYLELEAEAQQKAAELLRLRAIVLRSKNRLLALCPKDGRNSAFFFAVVYLLHLLQ